MSDPFLKEITVCSPLLWFTVTPFPTLCRISFEGNHGLLATVVVHGYAASDLMSDLFLKETTVCSPLLSLTVTPPLTICRISFLKETTVCSPLLSPTVTPLPTLCRISF